MSGKFKIDDAYVGSQGQAWANMPNAIKQFADYSAFNSGSPGDGLKADDFGQTPNAAAAAKAFLGLMQALDTSLAKVGGYCQAMSTPSPLRQVHVRNGLGQRHARHRVR